MQRSVSMNVYRLLHGVRLANHVSGVDSASGALADVSDDGAHSTWMIEPHLPRQRGRGS